MPSPLVFTDGFLPRAVVTAFLLSLRIRPVVGEPYGRAGGQALLWERSERAQGVAKIVPLTERLSGMCGSVRH
jgi:hypothetical protein